MKIKDFFTEFDINPISTNPLHGRITPELIDYINERNEEKRKQAIEQLGTKWLVHPSNQVHRKEAP